MRYFIDTEFIEDGRTIDLLSVGVVSEDGRRQLYALSTECDLTKASSWVRANVMPHLPLYDDPAWMTRAQLKERLLVFLYDGPHPPSSKESIELWSYFADYDWVAICQLYGRMVDLPPRMPMYCLDVKQLAHMLGNPEPPPVTGREHVALDDALWIRAYYLMLKERWNERPPRMV